MRKSREVNQGDIAAAVGLSRAAVSQILTSNPVGRFRPETIKKVISAARKMGYDFSRPTQRYRRRGERVPARVPVELEIVAGSGHTFSKGQGSVADISTSGLLITDINLQPATIPAEPFTIKLSFREGDLAGISSSARPVRFGRGASLRLGAEFVGARRREKARIAGFVRKHT